MTGTVNALIKHQATNDEQVLAEELEKVQADTVNRSTSRSFQNASAEMVREITDTVEELGLNLEQSEELADFRALWTPAYQNNDTSGLYAAYAEFLKVARRLERSKRETEVEATRRTAEEERRKQNEELGINDLDSGAGMPVSPNGQSLLTRLGNSETSVTRDEIAKAAEEMQKLGIRF
jgi:DNA-binding transcriptional regulator GbsR (MarR family)